MAGDVSVSFTVSCRSAEEDAGFDGDPNDEVMLLLSLQWPEMPAPAILLVSLHRLPREEGGGDDTSDVAAGIAGAAYSALGMGNIPSEHIDDMTILVDHDPQDPQSRGRTTGLLLLEGLTHFDVKCTDGKLRFNVGFTFDDGKPKSIRFAPVPERLRGGFPDIRPGHKKELVTLWETELGPPKEKKKKRKPKRRLLRGVFRSTDKPWWRIPIRPRYLQDPPLPAMKRDRARLSQAASRMEASILVSQRRWSHDERAHTTMIAQALKSAGIVVAPMEGAAWVYPPFPARRSVELEMNLNGSGILTDPLGPPCPWQLVIDLDPMSSRTWVTYAVTVDAISAARHAAVSASGLLAVKASGNDSPRENHAAAGVFKSILPEGHRPGAT